jgi:proteasome alpha subunit
MDIANFISPKQLIEIKREIAEEALARANPIIAAEYEDGIMIIGENPTNTLFKISELYDMIAFAGTGVYNDYEKLRKAGVQYADVKGFTYSRNDVKAKGITAEYSRILGDIFSMQNTPLEVEILVLELGVTHKENRMYYIPYTGALIEEIKFAVIGDVIKDSKSDTKRKNIIREYLSKQKDLGDLDFATTFRILKDALVVIKENGKSVSFDNIELAVLDRNIQRNRKFRRINSEEIKKIIS